ncbi:MAG: hypothetical protein HOO06_07865 [Bdellovibrionaceae bacterium]|jgi:hypothetical protein|nr:hypothetical protein [Pseudobdellovibrionaceae bacterium]
MKFIITFLYTSCLINIVTPSAHANTIMGDMPTWNNIVYGEGDEMVKESHAAYKASFGGQRSIKSGTGIGVLLVDTDSVWLKDFAQVGIPLKIVGSVITHISSQRGIDSAVNVTVAKLNEELNSNVDGRSFISRFGQIKSAHMNKLGMIKTFSTNNNTKFTLVNNDQGYYFISTLKNEDPIELFIEPNFITVDGDVK